MADNDQDPPDTWEARLAYAEELHDYVCRIDGCGGRDEHERRTGTSFMAVVTNPRAGSAYGVPPELAEYLPPDFAAPVASAPARAGEASPPPVRGGAWARIAPALALSATLGLQLAQSVVEGPEALLGLSEDVSHAVLTVAQLVLFVAGVYGYRPAPRTLQVRA